MYSTKLVHKGLVQDNAYITVGDPFKDQQANPFRQPKKGEKAPTPFQVKMIPQNAENGHFAKVTYHPEGYKETNKYITTQPLESRKNGFGTKDASRRDEFSNNIRTEQYRESIRKENELMNQNKDALNARIQNLLATRAMETSTRPATTGGSFSYNNRCAQFDIGRNRITQFDPKSIKDTYYKFDDSRPMRFGTATKPVSYDIGGSAWDCHYKAPEYGGRSEVKHFFDKSHLGKTYHAPA